MSYKTPARRDFWTAYNKNVDPPRPLAYGGRLGFDAMETSLNEMWKNKKLQKVAAKIQPRKRVGSGNNGRFAEDPVIPFNPRFREQRDDGIVEEDV